MLAPPILLLFASSTDKSPDTAFVSDGPRAYVVHFTTRMERISSKAAVLSSTDLMEIPMLLVAKAFSAMATPTFFTTITVSSIAHLFQLSVY